MSTGPTDSKQLATSVTHCRVELRSAGPASMSMGACDQSHHLISGSSVTACHFAACTDDRVSRMGLIYTTADWRGQICDGFRQPHIRPAQRPHLSVGTVSLSSSLPGRWRVEDCALWHQAVLDITPKGNCQLTRNSHDHNLSHPRALACSALNEPSGESALRLMPSPQPSGLNHNGTHVAAACPRNSLAVLLLAAAVGAWGKTQKASHLTPVGELPVIDFSRKQG